LEIFWLVISISLSTVSFVKMRESGIVGNGMGRAQFVCEASFRLNLFEGFLFQSETISDETPTIADAVTIYRVLLPAVLLFFFSFSRPFVILLSNCKMRRPAGNGRCSRLDTTAPVEGTHGGKESFYLKMDICLSFFFLFWVLFSFMGDGPS
jgi:hypothetical protein